jgi:hypothetical protein
MRRAQCCSLHSGEFRQRRIPTVVVEHNTERSEIVNLTAEEFEFRLPCSKLPCSNFASRSEGRIESSWVELIGETRALSRHDFCPSGSELGAWRLPTGRAYPNGSARST